MDLNIRMPDITVNTLDLLSDLRLHDDCRPYNKGKVDDGRSNSDEKAKLLLENEANRLLITN